MHEAYREHCQSVEGSKYRGVVRKGRQKVRFVEE